MSKVSGIALQGLLAASTRLAVSANNVANALTPGFVPSRATAEAVPGDGVATRVTPVEDPIAAARADRAIVGASGTDLVGELVDQRVAARAYEANLATLRTDGELEAALLSLKA